MPTSANGTFAGQCDISGQIIKVSFDMTKDRLLLNVPALKIANQPLQNLERHDETLSGKVMLGDQALFLRGRMTGPRLVGWIDFGGRPFAFAAELASPNSATR